MKRFFIFLPIFLLAAGCIQVRPRTQDHAPTAAPPAIKGNGFAAPEDPIRTDILNRIEKQKIRWDDISRYPSPEQLWREARFRQVRPDGRLKPGDFLFEKLVRLQGRRWKMSFIFLPLRVAYDGRRIWETRVDFTCGCEGNDLYIRMSSELKELSLPGILRLSASNCNAVSAAVLKTLFALQLPDGIRAKEKFRFCFPVNGADEKFRDHLRPRARILELPPDEEYPGLPVPFERGRYRSFAQGAFYYYAGIALPVTDKEVWVFDTAVRYAGGQTSGTYYKLKKGLLFWEIVTEGSYDAPSRAVRERESP